MVSLPEIDNHQLFWNLLPGTQLIENRFDDQMILLVDLELIILCQLTEVRKKMPNQGQWKMDKLSAYWR